MELKLQVLVITSLFFFVVSAAPPTIRASQVTSQVDWLCLIEFTILQVKLIYARLNEETPRSLGL